MTIKALQVPGHLAPATKRWWRTVMAEYRLEAHHVRLLTLACEAFDRCGEARRLIKRDGLVIPGREGGLRPHPAVAIERDCRSQFARLVAQLGLDVDEKNAVGRPPQPCGWTGPPFNERRQIPHETILLEDDDDDEAPTADHQ